jgi:hypothetical protein
MLSTRPLPPLHARLRQEAGLGRIHRANVEIPAGQTPATRSDIEIFFDGLPEPIDLEFDHKNRLLYWTDRGDPSRGNTVNRVSIDNPAKAPPYSGLEQEKAGIVGLPLNQGE